MCESREAELELAEAAFGNDFQIISQNEWDTIFTVQLTDHLPSCSIVLTFTLDNEYPRVPLRCLINGSILNSVRESLAQEIQQMIEEKPTIGVLSIFQTVQERLSDDRNLSQSLNETNHDLNKLSSSSSSSASSSSSSIQIARFLIYFHHIMCHYKRKMLVENAVDLHLGGYSKPGFPGIVIVEGLLDDVMEYVRRTQRLRWQHMVVRGEEIETIESPSQKSIDGHRKLPNQFQEIEGSMSDLGGLCRQGGLHDLFMTALRKPTSSTTPQC